MIQKWLRLLVKSLQSRIFSRSIWAQKWLVWTSRTSGNLVGVNHSFSSLFRYFSPLGDEIWKNFIWWLQSTFSSKLRFWHLNMATSNFRFLVYFESKPPMSNIPLRFPRLRFLHPAHPMSHPSIAFSDARHIHWVASYASLNILPLWIPFRSPHIQKAFRW